MVINLILVGCGSKQEIKETNEDGKVVETDEEESGEIEDVAAEETREKIPIHPDDIIPDITIRYFLCQKSRA